LREALSLGHNYIGTEHVLLGLIRVTDGVGAQVVAAHVPNGDLAAVRVAVIDLLPTSGEGTGGVDPRATHLRIAAGEGNLTMSPAAETALNEATKLAGANAVGSHHLLLAALADDNNMVSRTIAGLGLDVDQLRAQLQTADVTGSSDEPPEDAGRRQLRIHVTDNVLSIETAEPALVDLARAALDALGDEAATSGELPTDRPVSVSLNTVWRSLRDSLDDIRRRAATLAEPPSSAA
jgi:ATP-dependent Clp protease ATP-binding subunit ClpC